MRRGKVIALAGGQFGSEAKGLVAHRLADQFNVHIRTGGPNAGHTFYLAGTPFVARSIPCGWTNKDAFIIIGPGAIIDLEVFAKEFQQIQDLGYDLGLRLLIDKNAAVITKAQHDGEGGVGGEAHRLIGSTGEGVGLCRMARINRESLVTGDPRFVYKSALNARDEFGEIDYRLPSGIADTAAFVNANIDQGENVLLEGTQGSGLSLIHGPWPFATSADTNAGQLAVDAGISPSLVDETILVCRTFPIRVAGNSGPLANETSFEALGQAKETTTVTKKVRRIGAWDSELVKRSVMLNRPAKVIITFLNYLEEDHKNWVAAREKEIGAPIVAVSDNPYDYEVIKDGELEYV